MLVFSLDRAAAAAVTTIPMQLLGNFPVVTVKIDGNDVPLILISGRNQLWCLRRM